MMASAQTFPANCPHCVSEPGGKKWYGKSSFYAHLRQAHRPEGENSHILCKDCQQFLPANKLKRHMIQHAISKELVSCPFENCKTMLRGKSLNTKFYSKFKKHTLVAHSGAERPIGVTESDAQAAEFDAQAAEFDAVEDGADDFMDVDDGEEVDEEEPFRTFETKFWKLFLWEQFGEFLPERIVTEIATVLAQLAAESSDHLFHQLNAKLPGNEEELYNTFRNEDWLTNCLKSPNLLTAYGREQKASSYMSIPLPKVINNIHPKIGLARKSETYIVSCSEIIVRELERSNWQPDENGGFHTEFDYIKKLR